MFETASEQGCETARLTVYYDGNCPLCRSEIGFYATRRGAGAIRFVDATDKEQPLGSDLDRCSALSRFHVRLPGGDLRSGAAGFVAIWEALPGWRWLARLANLPGMPWLLERAYGGFLVVRPTLSRLWGQLLRRKS